MKACLESGAVYRSRERIMPKMKTHSGAKKRFSVTGSGKVRRLKAYKSHILTKKDPKRKPPSTASGAALRQMRPPECGLLLIYPVLEAVGRPPLVGFALSFPKDADAPPVEYAENSVKQLEDFFE